MSRRRKSSRKGQNYVIQDWLGGMIAAGESTTITSQQVEGLTSHDRPFKIGRITVDFASASPGSQITGTSGLVQIDVLGPYDAPGVIATSGPRVVSPGSAKRVSVRGGNAWYTTTKLTEMFDLCKVSAIAQASGTGPHHDSFYVRWLMKITLVMRPESFQVQKPGKLSLPPDACATQRSSPTTSWAVPEKENSDAE